MIVYYIDLMASFLVMTSVMLLMRMIYKEFRSTLDDKKDTDKLVLSERHLTIHANLLLTSMIGIVLIIGGVYKLIYDVLHRFGSDLDIIILLGSQGSFLILFGILNSFALIVMHLKEERLDSQPSTSKMVNEHNYTIA